ncbi:Signal transduction histidine-protein kinase BarA [Lacunisphaera limnophila]|uniref:histidine kinase n=1 Tax=Lacunisphaera limnophila TaxID=1838286 RepID=A0A1D8AW78_9BACT|nr:response regulator [Lacunisphaera limnophila]AOS45152.1 Signal transduction histidine-protein kinase BarA [Lacunisphaera limnophila]
MPARPTQPTPAALPRSRFMLALPVALPAAALVALAAAIAWVWLEPDLPPELILHGFATGCALVTALTLGYVIYATRVWRRAALELSEHQKTLNLTLPQLHIVWEKAPLSLMLFDPHDPDVPVRIVDCNPMACEIHGYTREELVGQSIDIIEAHPWAYRAAHDYLTDLRANQRSHGFAQHKRKDGSIITVEYSTSLVLIDGREYTIGIDRDATASKQAEEDLRHAKDAAEAATRAKSEFLANMSHEIRTPMNGVIGMSGLLLDSPLDPQQREFAETIRTSADTLLTVINDILDFSKIEAGKLVFEELEFDLVDTIEGTLDMLAERAQRKNLELLTAIPPELTATLIGDPGRLRQVLVNLIGNAIKFTERGEVVVRVVREQETATDVALRFSVVDTGIGIPADVQARLFQAFTQADTSTTRRFGGTGLGLAIAKQIVALMHGEIGVQSTPGAGATFWFTARFLKPAGAAARPAPTRDPVDLRVLVVDDNDTNRQILHHQIVSWKMQQGSAASGAEALVTLRAAAAAGQPYDAALLDMQMPGMDGLTLAHAIKADPVLARTHLIMLTSLGHVMTKPELAAQGIDAYLVKPVKQSRLFDCLVDVMGAPRAEPAAAKPVLPRPASPDYVAPAKSRILLAEDNTVNQKVALAQLRKLGHSADAVASGLEAVQAVAAVPYDLIFMDCQMPEMDGYEATQAIRQREQATAAAGRPAPRVHIIAMTANAMQGDREKCLAAGMDDYVSKPVRETDLRAALERWAAAR